MNDCEWLGGQGFFSWQNQLAAFRARRISWHVEVESSLANPFLEEAHCEFVAFCVAPCGLPQTCRSLLGCRRPLGSSCLPNVCQCADDSSFHISLLCAISQGWNISIAGSHLAPIFENLPNISTKRRRTKTCPKNKEHLFFWLVVSQ